MAASYAGSVRCDDALVARALGEAAGAAHVHPGGAAERFAAAANTAGVPSGYVEDVGKARTQLGAFLSILSVDGLRMTR